MLASHRFQTVDTLSPVQVGSDVSPEEWDTYVDGNPDATGYHTWRWRTVFEQAFGHTTRYLAARRNGAVVGVLPLVLFRSPLFGRFVVSLPFVNYGGVVADDAAAADALLAEAERLGREAGAAHLELRHQRRQFDRLAVKAHKVSMLLRLARTADAAWAVMDRKVRNQIRKAEKSGLTASVGGAECLDDFYRIFATNMRDLGTPVYPRAFFEQVLEAYGGEAKIVVVSKDGTAVAAGMTVPFRKAIEVPWASSLGQFRSMCPNHLLYWSVIQQAIAQGFDVLDFGRSTPGEGTFQFKQQWGAEPLPLYWEYGLFRGATLPDQSPKNPKFRMAIEMWKRCPLWLTNVLGPRIVRGIP